MIDFPPPTSRVLVKDGKWLVPESERPANWKDILPEKPAVSLLDEIINAPVQEPPIEPAPRERLRHKLYPRWEDEAWLDMKTAITYSLRSMDATDDLVFCGLILVAGMWTRTGPILRKMTGVRNEKKAVKRCYELGLWNRENRAVVIPGSDEEDPTLSNLEFFMTAMAIKGEIHRHPDGTFQSLEGAANAKSAVSD